jgi:hypothetical protein
MEGEEGISDEGWGGGVLTHLKGEEGEGEGDADHGDHGAVEHLRRDHAEGEDEHLRACMHYVCVRACVCVYCALACEC